MPPKSRAPAVLPISNPKVRSPHASQSDALPLFSASFPRVHGAGSGSSFASTSTANVKSLESHSRWLKTPEATLSDTLLKNVSAVTSKTRTSQERNKYPDIVMRVNETSDEQKCIDDITDNLSQRLHVGGSGSSVPSSEPPLGVVASSDL